MDIVEEIRTDRERGAKRLEGEYRVGLMTLARRLCHDEGDAEALVNHTFAEVLESIDNYVEQSAFFAWMCRILVRRHAKDTRRKINGSIVCDPEAVDLAVDEAAEERIFREVDASIARDAIEQLPEDIRKTLLLHYFMDIPVREIARILSVPAGTVKWRLHYARMILAAKLGAAAKKPGGKALLLALALCGLTALGAAVWNLAVPGEAQDMGGVASGRAAAAWTGATGGPFVPSAPDLQLQPTELPQQETTMNTTKLLAAPLAALTVAGAPLAASAAAPALDADLQSGLTIWLDASANLRSAAGASGAAVTAEGDAVNEWYDVRETSFASPTYPRASVYEANATAPTLASYDNLPFVDFGDYGSGQWMIFQAPGGSYPRYAARSAFFVLRFGETCNYPLGSVNGPTLNGGETCFTRASLGATWGGISDGAYANSVLPRGESRINGRRVNPASANFVKNAIQLYSQVGPGAVQRTFVANSPETSTGKVPWAKTLFNDRNYKPTTVSIARQGGGALGEMLLYDRVVTDAERVRIEAYLAEKWLGRAPDAIAYPASETNPLAPAAGEAQVFGRTAGRVYLAPQAGVAVTETGPVSYFEGDEGGSRLAATAASDPARFEIATGANAGGLLLALDPAALGASDVAVQSGAAMLSPRPAPGALAAAVQPDAAALESAAEAERAGYETEPGNLIANGSFEAPVRSGWSAYDPTGWARSGNTYLCNGTATPWWTRSGVSLADGNQFVACQANSTLAAEGSFATQTFTAPFAGLYRAVVRVSQRATGTTASALVKLDGDECWYHVIAYSTDARGTSDDWLEYEIDLPPLSAGSHSLALGIVKEDSTDRAALYDAVRVYPVAAGEFVAVPNPGFEAGPSLTKADGTANANGVYPGRYQYNPPSAHTFWTFASGGITQQDAPWWRISADGKAGWELRDQRKGFLQLGANSTTAYADATITAPRAGRVRLTMRLSKRYNNNNLGHWLDVLVGGKAVGRAWPVGNTQEPFACEFDIAAGAQALRLSMGRPASMSSQDLAIVFDDIRIEYIDGGSAAGAAPFADPTRGAGDLSGWTTTGGAALARNGSLTPNGVLSMPAGSAIETTFTLAEGGWYVLDALAAGAARETSSSNGVYNSYLHYPARAAITLDGAAAGTIQAESDVFERFTLRLPYLDAGAHTLRIERETVNLASSAELRLASLATVPVEVAAPADATDASIRVAEGATFRLDYPGTIKIKRLKGPDGVALVGVVDSTSCQDFLSGPGQLEIIPLAFTLIIR